MIRQGRRTIALEIPGVARPTFAGFSRSDVDDSSQFGGGLFPVLKPFEERMKHGQTAASIQAELTKRVAHIDGANILVVQPPSVPGLGSAGGFSMRLEDRAGLGTRLLPRRPRSRRRGSTHSRLVSASTRR